ncbi:amidohydrolase [Arthrobacter sp. I2-34]|uniref:Amidohydrolase n=1 Tax=Arthrobacter hankyongi TaxID=2904801 RepID=A0ABS9L655_9MICC|nr:amidohydrolase [Arthrobacter hankyongi]MCG2622152.1 amidohydrolase [Arthrobacter hankyongi]
MSTSLPSATPEHTGPTLYRNGSVYSPADPYATAMLIDNGTVAWVGSEPAASSIADGSMSIVDLDGRLVAPGFVDSHVHLTEAGLALESLDLTAAASVAQVLELVAEQAGREAGPVLGHGWDETRWPEHRPPTAAELDRAAGGREVYLSRVDAHSAVVSGSLAARAGLTAAEGWSASGQVRMAAHELARAAVRGLAPGRRREVQERALHHAAARGYVAVAEMGAPQIAPAEDLLSLLELDGTGPRQLPKVLPYWGELVRTPEELAGLVEHFGGRLRGLAGDLNIDGSIGSHTACVHGGYADAAGEPGMLFLGAEEAARHLELCTEAGIQGGFHVIGDAGLDRALEALELAAQRVGEAKLRAAGHRLEHVEMLPPGAVGKLLDYGISVSMQPLFDAYWGGNSSLYAARLGTDRALGMNAVGTLQTAGVPVCLGSDAPVTAQDPWATVRACLEHHNPAERISARAAFLAHTRAGWRAAGEPNPLQGQLAPGTPATFAVWDVQELSVQTPDNRVSAWSTDARAGTPLLPSLDVDRMPRCERTVIDGATIYDSGALGR